MVSKKDWLEETLEREGIEVLIYNGNLDVIVNVAGTNRLVNSLRWSGKGEFAKSERKSFWVWNPETGRGELGNKTFYEKTLCRKNFRGICGISCYWNICH